MMSYNIKNKTLLGAASLFLAATVLSGCGMQKMTPMSKPQLVAEADTVSLMLAEAAGKASRALETLASVEQYRTPQAGVSTIPDAPAELQRGMSVEWVGPAEPLVSEIARRSSYKFVALGDKPSTPIIVSVYAQNKQIIDVLRDAGLQMGQRANLNVDAQRRVIEIQYAPMARKQP